jgi:cell wall-associated NlpC family hydrolase
VKIQRQRDAFAYRIADMMPSGGMDGGGANSSANSAEMLVNNVRNQAVTDLGNSVNGTQYEYGGSGPGTKNVATDSPSSLYDCSGLAGSALALMQGKDPNPAGSYVKDTSGERLNTTSDFTDMGMEPGTKPGTFQVGVNPNPEEGGHMAVQTSSGQGLESASSGEKFGPAAKPVTSFPKQYYLPKSEVPPTSSPKSLSDVLLGGSK